MTCATNWQQYTLRCASHTIDSHLVSYAFYTIHITLLKILFILPFVMHVCMHEPSVSVVVNFIHTCISCKAYGV